MGRIRAHHQEEITFLVQALLIVNLKRETGYLTSNPSHPYFLERQLLLLLTLTELRLPLFYLNQAPTHHEEDTHTLKHSEKNGQTSVHDTKKKMIKTIESGDKISSIILNGGTTYNHTIDEIKAIVDLRNYMTEKYELDYKPHIHVDSVIGWS